MKLPVFSAIFVLVCVASLTEGFNPDDMIQCCDCITMFPDVSGSIEPQVVHSPFRIVVSDQVSEYRPGNPGEDINGMSFYIITHLTHSHTMTPFDALTIYSCRKHCEKRRNCL